jgi:hypothetical protein
VHRIPFPNNENELDNKIIGEKDRTEDRQEMEVTTISNVYPVSLGISFFSSPNEL